MSGLSERIANLSVAKRALLEQLLRAEDPSRSKRSAIGKRKTDGECAPSFAQERLWFLAQLDPGDPAYNSPYALRLRGALNVKALENALNAIVARHESLRTALVSRHGHPSQVITAQAGVALGITDLSHVAAEARTTAARRAACEESRKPFDLTAGLMIRARLLRLAEEDNILLLALHHIATDGWSEAVLYRELSALYSDFCASRSSSLAPLAIQYADFACWQRERVSGETLDQQLRYWRKQLAGAETTLALPTDHPRSPVWRSCGARVPLSLSREMGDSLLALSRKCGATLYMTLTAALNVLLYRYTHQEDILLGSPIANREQSELEGLIGFFANTIVLRIRLAGNPTFTELLERVRKTTLEAYEHQDVPFEKLVEELHPERDLSHNPLAQVVFAFQNVPRRQLELPGLAVEPFEVDNGTAKFDLMFAINETPDGLSGFLEYSTDLFERSTIERMLAHFRVLLDAITADPAQRLSDLPLLTEEERRRILVEFNATQANYPRNKCVHQLFEEQAARRPDNVAMVFHNQCLTYAGLNCRANQLARRLRRLGAKPGSLIGLCMDRSLEMVIGLLGILKAGGAYVPLDPAYPRDRLRFMLEDTKVSLLLSQSHLVEHLPETRSRIISLDERDEEIAGESNENLETPVSADDLAYVVYTSGSTGIPKGAEIPHRGIVRLLFGCTYATFDESRAFLQLAPISFDASTFELWGALLHGARCVLFPGRVPTAKGIEEIIRAHGITTLWLTASLFNTFIDEAPDIFASITELLTGGEALSVPHVMRALDLLPNTVLINGYGPTESTTFTCCYRVPRDIERNIRSIPIGRPIGNTEVYILDRHLHPVPVGVPGELYIGGAGLARGYLNRPELTAERFIPHPFSKAPKTRLYKTGDIAKYRPDGAVEFLGRADHQVKIRGFRVELGEIESVLSQHPDVKEVVVLAREEAPGNKPLVAYVVPRQSPMTSTVALRNFLVERLPDYMIPADFLFIERMPLSPTGKVDRRALPAVQRPFGKKGTQSEEPSTLLERQLAQIWEHVLSIKRVGVRDNFFDLGGHSLLAVRVFSKIQNLFGKKLPLATLFKAPTVEKLAAALQEQGAGEIRATLVPIKTSGSCPPFFCVASMDALSYMYLARRMDSEQPFYALQPLEFLDVENPHIDVACMARHYINAIRTVQSAGPYIIGGMCSGGVLAFEIAQQLLEQGDEVALLALVDTPRPLRGWLPSGVRWLVQRLGYHLGKFRTLRPREMPGYVFDRLRGLARKIMPGRRPGTGQAETRNVTVSYWKPIAQAYLRFLPDYTPRPYTGRIALFLGRETDMGTFRDPRLAWKELLHGEVEVHLVPGDHVAILREPHVRKLAAKLNECLRSAQIATSRTPPNSTTEGA